MTKYVAIAALLCGVPRAALSQCPTGTISVPNVVGQTQAIATAFITNAGLVVGTVTMTSSISAAGQVLNQNPPANTLVVAGSAVNVVVSSGPSTTSTVNVISQIATGGGWLTSIYLFNTSSSTGLQYSVEFLGATGQPIQVPIAGIGPTTTINGALANNTSTTWKTLNQSTSVVAFALVTSSTANLNGYAVFTNTVNGNEATAPFTIPVPPSLGGSYTLILPFDLTSGLGMGIALASLGQSYAGIEIFNSQGEMLVGRGIGQGTGAFHTSFDLGQEFPEAVGQTGYMMFYGVSSALGIRYNPQGAFTSIAEIPVQ